MSKTCMCWGFSCSDGWYDIIDTLCKCIENHIDNINRSIEFTKKWNNNVDDPEYEWTAFVPRKKRKVPKQVQPVIAIQVKEKFGGLRFYYSGGDDYIRGLVDMAESMSYKTCEVCGSPGKPG